MPAVWTAWNITGEEVHSADVAKHVTDTLAQVRAHGMAPSSLLGLPAGGRPECSQEREGSQPHCVTLLPARAITRQQWPPAVQIALHVMRTSIRGRLSLIRRS